MIGLTGQQFQKVGQAAAVAAQMRQNQRQGHGQQAGGRCFGNPALPCQFGSRIGGVTVKHGRQQTVAQIDQAFGLCLNFVRRQATFRAGLPVKGGCIIGIAGRALQYAGQNGGQNQFCRLRARFGVFAGGGQKSAEDGDEFFLQQRAETGGHGGVPCICAFKMFSDGRAV